jgi:hypothetical protein
MKKKFSICVFFILAFIFSLFLSESYSQCTLINDGTISTGITGSSGLCAPRTVTVSYSFGLVSPAPLGSSLAAIFNWNDGQANQVEAVFLTVDGTTLNYVASRSRTFPANSDCEYEVLMGLSFNGSSCSGFAQIQRVNSWRRDDSNGGTIALSPTPVNFCQGVNISQTFNDISTWNCVRDFISSAPSRPSNPNEQTRWQQYVYNTKTTGGPRIPNVFVNGVQVTDAAGLDVINNYQDPRGVNTLPFPVLVSTAKRPSLNITAAGGFGPGFPVTGQIFEVTLRNWNACNPYDDPSIPGPPVDLINGDNAPIEGIALIRIITNPPALTAVASGDLCYGTALTNANTFEVAGTTGSTTNINWYNGDPLAGGTLLVNPLGGNSTTFRMSSYPASAPGGPINTSRAAGAGGVYALWATQVYNGTNLCESQAVQVTRVVRPQLTAPAAPTGILAVCNNTALVNYTQAAPAAGTSIAASTFTNPALVSFPTEYFWDSSTAGVSFSSTTGTSVNVNYALVEPAPPTASIVANVRTSLRYTNAPQCTAGPTNRNVTVFYTSNGGSVTGSGTYCDGQVISPVALVANSFRGTVQDWEMELNGVGGFNTLGLPVGTTSFVPAVPIVGAAQTTYRFRAEVQNSLNCAPVFSPVVTITVNPKPTSATLVGGALICQGNSTNLVVNIVDGTPPYTVVYRANGVNQPAVTPYTSGTNIPVSPLVTTTYDLFSVTDFRGCTPTTNSGTAIVQVSNATSATIVGNANICPSTTTNLAVNIIGGLGTSYTINYTANLVAQPPIVGYVSGANIPVSPAITTTYRLTSVIDNNGCPVLSLLPVAGVVVTVGSTPTSAIFSGGGTVCQNVIRNLNLAITGGVAPYTVTVTPTPGAPFNILGYVSGSSIPVPTGVVGSIDYNVTFVSDACGNLLVGAVTNNPQTVIVTPVPTATALTTLAAICSNSSTNIPILATSAVSVPSSFTWNAAYTAGLTGGAASGSGANIVTGPLVNAGTNIVRNATFTITPTASVGGCPGATFQIVQPVNVEPVATLKTTTAVCSNAAFNFDPQTVGINGAGGNSVPSTFSWVGTYPAGLTLITPGTGTGNIAETIQNLTGASINASYLVTPTSVLGSCVGTAFTILVPVRPEPVATLKTTTAVCSNVAFSFNPQTISINGAGGNSVASSFTWSRTLPIGLTLITPGTGTGNIAERIEN